MRSTDSESLRIIDLWTFRSSKSNKRYIVEIEHFPRHFLGVKFYWKGVTDSKDRYSFLTMDYEPRKIVMSCIMIMLSYYQKNSNCSFGFVASYSKNEIKDINGLFPNKRFRFYRRMMLTLFSPEFFIQAIDIKNSLYLLINKKEFKKDSVSEISDQIEKIFSGNFNLNDIS